MRWGGAIRPRCIRAVNGEGTSSPGIDHRRPPLVSTALVSIGSTLRILPEDEPSERIVSRDVFRGTEAQWYFNSTLDSCIRDAVETEYNTTGTCGIGKRNKYQVRWSRNRWQSMIFVNAQSKCPSATFEEGYEHDLHLNTPKAPSSKAPLPCSLPTPLQMSPSIPYLPHLASNTFL